MLTGTVMPQRQRLHEPTMMKAPRLALAALVPFAALGLQWLLWPVLQPFAWFLFFPAVFFSARLGGFAMGIYNTVVSTVLVWYFFIAPQLSWKTGDASQLYRVGLFLLMGYLFSRSELHLSRANRNIQQADGRALAASQQAAQLNGKTLELENATQELQRYQQIVSTTAEMLGMVDRDRCYVLANPAYAAMLGIPAEAMQGRKVADVIGADNYAHIEARLDRAMAGEAQHYLAEPMLADGKRRVLDVQYCPYIKNGNVQGVVVDLRDVTETRDAVNALKISEERLRLALEANNDGLWDRDLTTGNVYRSQRFYDLAEYSPEEAEANLAFFQSIVHPEDRPRVMLAIQAHERGEAASLTIDFRLVTRSGKIKWMRVKGSTVSRDAAGTPLRIIGTIMDINVSVLTQEALRRQAAELAQRNEELERFNRATVGREVDMIALKQQVNAMALELGRAAPYPLRLLADSATTVAARDTPPDGQPA